MFAPAAMRSCLADISRWELANYLDFHEIGKLTNILGSKQHFHHMPRNGGVCSLNLHDG
jgi:hypothetical protein